MIKYNNNTINDWNFGTSNIKKVYRNGAVVYYKLVGSSPTPEYRVCYAVVDDISQYQDRTYVDVYDKATSRFYKLNNLNQYEEYGIYGSGRTSCEGSFRLPQGYTEVEYIENTGTSYINTNIQVYSSTTDSFEIESKLIAAEHDSQSYQNVFSCMSEDGEPYQGFSYRYEFSSLVGRSIPNEQNTFTIVNNEDLSETVKVTSSPLQRTYTHTYPLTLFCSLDSSRNPFRWTNSKFYYCKIKMNDELVRDFVPAKRDSDDKYGMYDIVNDVFYVSPNNVDFSGGEPITPTVCVTTYNDKLTIDEGYEYEWNGSSWVNIGEVSGTTESYKYWMWRSIGDLNTEGLIQFSEFDLVVDGSDASLSLVSAQPSGFSNEGPENLFDNNTSTKYCASFTSYETTNYVLFEAESAISPTTFSMTTANDSADYNRHPKEWALYGSNTSTTDWNDGSWTMVVSGTCGNEMCVNYTRFDYPISGSTVLPKYYTEKTTPLDNLTFNTMSEANTYAYNNCVYQGMRATINGAYYYFDTTNGWTELTYYYRVEHVSGSSGDWVKIDNSAYNPDMTNYDGYMATNLNSYEDDVAKVTIYGYEHFTYYIRTQCNDDSYIAASNIDEIQSDITNLNYDSSEAISNTLYWSREVGSVIDDNNYRRITYNNLDTNVEHTFYVSLKKGWHTNQVGVLIIPKSQDNELWEEVILDSNIDGYYKNLYINDSYITNYYVYRWIAGLPSGNNSTYTNYNDYYYCPSENSFSFTSVAGNVRNLEFTYNNIQEKNILVNLVDESGNTITPSESVYVNMPVTNSCSIGNSYYYNLPTLVSAPIGGYFSFETDGNNSYIYGYDLPSDFGSTLYTDNLSDTYNLVYRKLNTEAVTITYSLYDPNDTEVPSFSTSISSPRGSETKTTLSFEVPYTYTYSIATTNDKLKINSQTYTASQPTRTISLIFYPNNRVFSTLADLQAYGYAWEGMIAYVGETMYKYENGEWVEKQHSLPDIPFVLNYNAKNYNENTHRIEKTDGQLNDIDAIAVNNPSSIVYNSDGYLTISESSMQIRIDNQDISLFNRSNGEGTCELTIITKAKTSGSDGNIITNRDGNYNWMYRQYYDHLTFHGTSETGQISCSSSNADILSVRTYYDNGSTVVSYNNWTQNTSTSPINFEYGYTNTDDSRAGALFVGYDWTNGGEQWVGDFYWVYMAQAKLTDEQIQQVIDYNENL